MWIIFTIPVVTLLSFIRDYQYLAPTSTFGILALCLAVIFTCYDIQAHETPQDIFELPLLEMQSFPLFIGNACFLYLVPTAMLPLVQSLCLPAAVQNFSEAQSVKHAREILDCFSFIFCLSLTMVTFLNIPFMVYCYAAFSTRTKENILENLSGGPFSDAVKVFLCLDLLFTAALFLFPVTEELDLVLFGSKLPNHTSNEDGNSQNTPDEGRNEVQLNGQGDNFLSNYWKGNIVRALFITMISLIATEIPYFGLITGLSGSFGANILTFIVPPYLYFKVKDRAGYWRALGGFHEHSQIQFQLGNDQNCDGHVVDVNGQANTTKRLYLMLEVMGLQLLFILGVFILIVSSKAYLSEIGARNQSSQ